MTPSPLEIASIYVAVVFRSVRSWAQDILHLGAAPVLLIPLCGEWNVPTPPINEFLIWNCVFRESGRSWSKLSNWSDHLNNRA
jgi:hypothetical protein